MDQKRSLDVLRIHFRNDQRTAQAARACKGRTRNWEKSEDERCRGRAVLNRQLYVTALL